MRAGAAQWARAAQPTGSAQRIAKAQPERAHAATHAFMLQVTVKDGIAGPEKREKFNEDGNG